MKKMHLTEKEIRKNYPVSNIYLAGYCHLQRTLDVVNCEPFAYTATRKYGWKADFYSIDGAIISTGYAPLGGIRIPYGLAKRCEAKTEKIVADFNRGKIKKWSTVQKHCKKVLIATLNRALELYNEGIMVFPLDIK